MNDREWDDYMLGNPASPYPRVQDIQNLQKGREGQGPTTYGPPGPSDG